MLANPAVQAFVTLAQKRSFPPRHVVISAGDLPQSVFLILEGTVSVLRSEHQTESATLRDEDADPREIVLAYLKPGDFFGEMCLFPELNTRSAMVRTRTPTLLAEVEYEAFRTFADEHPQIMFAIAGQLAARLRDTSRRLGDLAFLDVTGRVAQTLLSLAGMPEAVTGPNGRIVRISRQELARLVGCSREMVGRVLKRLEEDGVIACVGRTICLFDPVID